MTSLTSAFSELLRPVLHPGDFCTSGTVEIFTPLLDVEGVGPVAIPCLPLQMEQLITASAPAPYGRGEQTLVDTQVRRTWQIDADRVRLQGCHWDKTLESLVARVTEGLGVEGAVVAELYKLLVYDEGSFFTTHRDTEKAQGMFATLVVVLPSVYTGGELIVRHLDRQFQFDLRCSDPSEAAFAAFYADCAHEVLPVLSGCRLTLIYNLLLRDRSRVPKPPSHTREAAQLATLLREWRSGQQAMADSPEKLIYPLEHAYTQAGLAFASLKGADAARAAVLISAAQQADCDIHLALLSIDESGAAEYTGSYGRRRGWSDDEAFEAGEVYERSTTLSNWHRPDGRPFPLGPLSFLEEELSPPDALEGIEPDEELFQESTGNEGASFERTYRRAALVLWPREQRMAVISQGGLPVTLPYLEELVNRWTASGEGLHSPLWSQAQDLAKQILASWPHNSGYSRYNKEASQAARMLLSLAKLRDSGQIEAVLTTVSAMGLYGMADNDAILEALVLLPTLRAIALIESIITGNASTNPMACSNLLARAVQKMPSDTRMADFVEAATALLNALPGNPERAAQEDAVRLFRPVVEPGLIVDLMTTLGRIDATLADQAVALILAQIKTYDLDTILLPAMLVLNDQTGMENLAAVQRLRTICLDHLQKRVAEPLEPPGDWAREHILSCRCSHCSELALFLADAERKTWNFKASEHSRRHVEETVRQSNCDLDGATDKRGRPYTLVCTKNQASYERRVRQRKKDLADLARMGPPEKP
ncbi:2OG-Fe(II) oxygenase [Candidatus Magnetaquicoccus inordinatus]|uniref:2OG-Fe(II) oxygenase n=1 Tax=Candidatus Magnetaquicoccus inordinatus TaxID=2496818 RepID=UPI00102B7D09|nr:2OG-Fe(II) oxygenase [Candidatus Magnetaquicoccus inordinatus]